MKTRAVQFGLLLALGSSFVFAQSVTLRYFYDANHQLVGVLDSSGNYVQYVYDPAGNPTQITRSVVPSGSLSILNFSPQKGGPGTRVTIQGQGFSPTPGNDTVNFNGVAANVISASATQLVVTVPSAAHTGPLSVTVGGNTAQGGTFTVQTSLVSLAITPSGPSIALGSTQQFTATGTYSDTTTQNLTTAVTWSSSATNVATIANSGLATSVAIGGATITATYASASGTVANSTTLTVKAVAPVSIAVTPNSPSINVGATQQLTATGTYPDNSMQNVTTMATWSSSNPAVATVSNSSGTQGQVIGLSAGTSTITATVGSVFGMATVTVSTPPSSPFLRFLYVTNSTTGISVYSVSDSSGQLRPLNVAPLVSSLPPSYGSPPVVTGSFLYLSSTFGSDLVDGYALNANNGSLTLLSDSPFWAGIPNGNFSGRDQIVVTPSGQYAYVVVSATSSSPPQAVAFSINSTTGALTVASQTSFGNTSTVVADIAMDPQGRFLYVVHDNQLDRTPTVHVLALNPATGAATPVAGSPFSGGMAQSIPQIVPTPSGTFLYALDSIGRQIQGFSVNGSTGALTTLAPVSAGSSPSWIAVTPSSNYLYVHDTFNLGNILAFSINSSTGALTQINGSPFATPQGSDLYPMLATDPSGKYLYASVRDNSVAWWDIATYGIDPGTGSLSLLSSTLSQFGTAGFAFLQGTAPVSYTPAFAYTANNLDNDLSLFSVTASTGALTPLSGSPLAGFLSPSALTIDTLGKFALTVDQNGLGVFAINPATGSLTASGSSATGANPAAVAVDPLDRFVFVANQAADTISAFQFNALNGTLTPAPGSPFAAGATPSGLALDPSGQLLLAANADSDLSAYYINQQNGSLSNPASFDAGTNPIAVAIEASGHYAYVVNRGSNNISIYRIHIGAPGPTLQLLNTLALPAGTTLPQAASIDPSGHFLYVAGGPIGSAGTVSAYGINPSTGSLTPVPGMPFPAGLSPASVTVDPSGMFLYVTNSGANNVSIYSINASTGVLSPVPAPVAPAGATPLSTAVSPKIQ